MFWVIVPEEVIQQGELTLTGGKAHHLGRVLRVRPGERGIAVAAARQYRVEVVAVSGARVSARVLADEAVVAPRVAITLLQAVLPNPDFDAVLEGVTAIGVSRVVAIQAARSVRRPGPDRLGRWRTIAEASAEQSHAPAIPEVDGPMALSEALARLDANLLVLHPGVDRPLSQAYQGSRPHVLAVGPEGGWTDDELLLLERAGGVRVDLGPRILRSRLAPIVAAAILLHQP